MKQYSKGIITTVLVLMFVGLVTATTISNTQITGFTDIIFSNGASITENGDGLEINSPINLSDNSLSEIYAIRDNNYLRIEGTQYVNNGTSQHKNVVQQLGRNNGTDSTGASYRMAYEFFIKNTSSAENRGLSMTVHGRGDNISHPNWQPNQVSFYSYLINGSGYTNKPFEWNWGQDSDGVFYLPLLNQIRLGSEGWTGFFQNETPIPSRIETNDNKIEIRLDIDGDDEGSSNEEFLVTVVGEGHLFKVTESQTDIYSNIEMNNNQILNVNKLDVGNPSNTANIQVQTTDSRALFLENDNVNSTNEVFRLKNQGSGTSYIIDNNGNSRALILDSESSFWAPLQIEDVPVDKAIAIQTSDKICLDGNICSAYIMYNGSCVISSNGGCI